MNRDEEDRSREERFLEYSAETYWERLRRWSFILAGFFLAFMVLGLALGIFFGRTTGYVVSAISAMLLLILAGYLFEWTGFGTVPLPRTDGREIQPRKLLWDWLVLLSALAVPIVIAVAGFWFTNNQNAQQQRLEDRRNAAAQELADQRAQVDREIEEQRAQDEALQAYLDQMSQLLLEKNLLGSEQSDPAQTLAQARTTTIISRLDAEGNLSVTRFLTDSGLTGARSADLDQAPTVSLLNQTDLRGADLAGAFLPDANLEEAKLQGADLSDASLATADLSEANLEDADLEEADLFFADLSNANLRGANLEGTSLDTVKLQGATLEGADLPLSSPKFVDKLIDLIKQGRNLDGANLEGADLSGEDLTGASLEGAALSEANLSTTKLGSANLKGANLSSAILSNAGLKGANLEGANLEKANLKDATLSETNLKEASVTEKQLDLARSLEGATMPNGQKYEDWLKSRGSGEEAENNNPS
jgi:uncharacterized protein YjbI with pentapeptide repeats